MSKSGINSTPTIYIKKCSLLTLIWFCSKPYDLKNLNKNINPTNKREPNTAGYCRKGEPNAITIINGINKIGRAHV